MAVKYECPKCGRRFIDWGAERLGYQCPKDDRCTGVAANDIITLIRIGSGDDADLPSASLRRRAKKEVIAVPVEEDVDDVVDDEEVDDDDAVAEEEVEEDVVAVVVGEDHVAADEDVVDEDEAEDASDEEVPEDLDFGTEKVDFDEGPAPEFDD